MPRFLMLLRAAAPATRGGSPPPELYQEVARHIAAGVRAGMVLCFCGLAPVAMSVRIRLADGVLSTVGGPEADEPEQLLCYALLETFSQADAVRIATEFMDLYRQHWPGWSGTSEIRQVFQPAG